MKKYLICLLLVLCLLLTACGTRQEESGQDGDTRATAYQTGGDAEEQKTDTPLLTERFSGTLPDGQQELTVDFHWCVYQGTVYVEQPSAAETRMVVEPISGCTTAVTVLVLDGDRLDHGRYALARLESQTLEWLFPELLQEMEIRQLEMTPDLSGAVFLKRVPEGDGFYELPFYCNGQQLIDLEQSCGLMPHTSGAVGVRWAGEDILLTLSNSWVQEDAATDVYCYHTDSGLWEQVADAAL